MENPWRKQEKRFSTVNDIFWDIHKHILWVVLFFPNPTLDHYLSQFQNPVLYGIDAKPYAVCVWAIMGTTKLEDVSIEETPLP